MPPDEPLTLSIPQFAKRLGVGRLVVERLIAEGKIRTVPLTPIQTRIPVSELKRLVEEGA